MFMKILCMAGGFLIVAGTPSERPGAMGCSAGLEEGQARSVIQSVTVYCPGAPHHHLAMAWRPELVSSCGSDVVGRRA